MENDMKMIHFFSGGQSDPVTDTCSHSIMLLSIGLFRPMPRFERGYILRHRIQKAMIGYG